ncbi:hypothetical protein OBBRIDRAFT_152996 [Obba rivulosa]|uniref:Uncharacterized protein n=1 Tax=Obba rivulosa TaxID=1052685 RepID=A0A8E2AQI9_9APHY|nr:hypothetical protein OBBRIDRAFT_152996 [Obba rivulosa]
MGRLSASRMSRRMARDLLLFTNLGRCEPATRAGMLGLRAVLPRGSKMSWNSKSSSASQCWRLQASQLLPLLAVKCRRARYKPLITSRDRYFILR